MSDEKKCSAGVRESGRGGYLHKHSCTKPYFVSRSVREYSVDNKAYEMVCRDFCKIHDPEYKKAKQDAKYADYDLKWKKVDRERMIQNKKNAIVDYLMVDNGIEVAPDLRNMLIELKNLMESSL